MERDEQKIWAVDVVVGMYVSRLDKPWLGTPFPLQGMTVHDEQQIEQLIAHCQHVFIDVERSRNANPMRLMRALSKTSFSHTPTRYADSASISEEMPRAAEARLNAQGLTNKIMDDIRAGQKLSLIDVAQAVEPVVKSIIRNADAFFWISSLRRRDAYIYSHAINCSMLAAAFGRHLGFPEGVLISLASGGLLLDIGKSDLPDEVLLHPGPLSDEQRRMVRGHVAAAMRLLQDAGEKDAVVLEMVQTHHERFDGSGYPDGLRGSQIPLYGRMAAVIDTYDAMSSDRTYQKNIAQHEALQHIYRGRGKLFQPDVVEQFLQCLSVYPTGSLVELNTGQVAIVMAQNPARRLRPKVMILMTAGKQLYEEFQMLDLLSQESDDTGRVPVEISTSLEPGAYGLNPSELYLQ